MGFKEEIKRLSDALDLSQILARKGYRIDKRIFRGALLLILFLLCVSAYLDGFSILYSGRSYFECQDNPIQAVTVCMNPVYHMCEHYPDDCMKEYLFEGDVVGVKPSWLSLNLSGLSILIVLLAGGLNHVIHNYKRRRF